MANYSTGTLTLRGGEAYVYGSEDVDFVANHIGAGHALVLRGYPDYFSVKRVVNARMLELTETLPGKNDVEGVSYALCDDFSPVLNLPLPNPDSMRTPASNIAQVSRLFSTLDDELPLIPPGYAGRWRLDGDADDIGPNFLNGVATGISYATGVRGQAASFDPVQGSLIQVAHKPALLATTFSFAIWVKSNLGATALTGAWQTAFMRTPDDSWMNGGFGMGYHNPPGDGAVDTVYFWVSDYAVNRVGALVPANAWVHLVGVYDGASVKIYRNGALASSVTTSGVLAPPANIPLRIGQSPGGASDCWNGALDDLIFYARALSAAEVAKLYAAYQRKYWA